MNIYKLRNKTVKFGFIYKSIEDLFESIIQSNEHQLLLKDSINKLNLKDLTSGGISLVIFSIMIMISAKFSKNVRQLFISISSSLRMKGNGIVIPLID